MPIPSLLAEPRDSKPHKVCQPAIDIKHQDHSKSSLRLPLGLEAPVMMPMTPDDVVFLFFSFTASPGRMLDEQV